ncbi:hypothetical protein [Rathayibacter sp. AY1E2]|uniref:hypothetical protein n=1 Tax=Rathayibacter sp. AY1E2 TaxID=2080550 RepID=UPI0011B0063C|nr:hypothetical protein [Rathayibacter sp. AY1E2]
MSAATDVRGPRTASRRRRTLVELGWALVAALVSVVAAVLALGIGPQDLTARWTVGGDDQILHYTLFTSATQAFPFDGNAALGFPDGFNAFFSAQFDVASALAVSVLALVVRDGTTLLNVFYLGTFATVAVTGYVFFRALRTRPWVAAFSAVLLSLLPYHFLRIGFGHAFLANYWAIPLLGVMVLMVAGPRTDPLRAWSERGATRRSRVLRSVVPGVVLGLLVASTGGYYYVFAVLVLGATWAVSTAAGLLSRERLRVLAVSSVPILALGVFVGLSLLLLSLDFGERYSPYFTSRTVGESEAYAGKLVLLGLPWSGTGLPQGYGLLNTYAGQSGVAPTTEPPGFSILASVALLITLVALPITALGGGRALRATAVGRFFSDARVRVLAVATLAALLFYTVTGLGVVVSLVAGPTIRAWARMSIVIAVLVLGVLALLLDRITARGGVRILVAALLAAVAVVDQLAGVSAAVPIAPTDDSEMRSFVSEADAQLDDGCGVVELPLKSFPDSGRIGALADYDEALPYLATEEGRLRWSYGAVEGTYGWDVWGDVDDPAEFADAVAGSGACAVYVDTAGYTDDPDGWRAYVEAATGDVEPEVASASGRWLLFTTRR